MTIMNDSHGEKRLYIGIVVDCHPDEPNYVYLIYVYVLGKVFIGHTCRKIRESSIRVVDNDIVLIELRRYDQTKGRIVERLDNSSSDK